MLKINENPPVVWPEVESISDFVGQWWVAHISYFLPMSWKVRRRSRRTIRSFLPLFSGYLFFCGEEDQRLELLRTDRVANLIEVKDQQKLIRELVQIEQALRIGAPLTPHKYIKAGQKCKVMAGPLLGLQGVVVKTKSATRLVLQVDMLGQAASVEIDVDMIEILD